MASNSILKLQVDDKQYEASLKNAQQGLKALQDALRNSGKSFADVDKQTEEYVRALGKMGTTAKTARGGIGEMSSAFVELSRVEKQLTDQERQSPVGKALTESLAQLKQRTIDAKNELQGLENQIKNVGEVKLPDTGGFLSGDKMSGMLQVMGGNLMAKGVTLAAGAVTSLVNEIGDAVKQGVELAKQGEGIRNAFERLGRGDLLDGLREATHGTMTDLELMKAAVKFDDFKLPLDELGTMLAFAQKKAKDTGQSVDYMADSIVTGLGRKSVMILDNLGLSATEIRERMKETGDMTKAVGDIIREQMQKAGDYVETAADRAAQANVSLQNKMEELGRKFAPLEEASNSLWTSMKIGIMDVIGGPLTDLLNKLTATGRMMNAYGNMGGSGKVGRMTSILAGTSEQNRQSLYQQQQQQFLKYINPREQQIRDIRAWQSGQRGEALQGRIGAITEKYGSLDATKIQAEVDAAKKMLADYQSAAKQILQPIKQEITPTITTSGGTTGGKGTTKTPQTELQQNQAEINRLTQEYVRLGDMSTQSAEERKAAIQDEIEKLKERNGLLGMYAAQAEGRLMLTGSDINIQGLGNVSGAGVFDDAMKKAGEGIKITTPLQLDDKTIKKVQESLEKGMKSVNLTKEIGNISSGVGQVFGSLEQLGIDLPDGLTEVVGGMQSVISLLTGITSIITAIEAIAGADFIKPFAGGGVVKAAMGYEVPGNHYSGDLVPALLNSGETVLNRAQSGIIASALDGAGGGFKNGTIVGVLEGEKIKLVLNRHYRRIGEGEIVTWKNG